MDLLNRYASTFDRSARHLSDIRADAASVVVSIRNVNIARSRVVQVLLERLCDVKLLDLHRAPANRGLTLETLQRLGCIVLQSRDEREVAVGAILTMSAAKFTLLPADARTFAGFARPDAIKVLWHLYVTQREARLSTLALETRLRAIGPGAGRLLQHWDAFARLGTLGRREVVAAIKAEAELGLNGDLSGRKRPAGAQGNRC